MVQTYNPSYWEVKEGKTGIQGHSGLIASLMTAWGTKVSPQQKQKNTTTRTTTMRQWKLTSSSVVLGLKSLLPPPGEK